MEPWLSFYEPFFETADAAEQFITACEAKAPPNLAAKVIMHQAQRLVSISDELLKIRRHEEPLSGQYAASTRQSPPETRGATAGPSRH